MSLPARSVLRNIHISGDVGRWYREEFTFRRGAAGSVFGAYFELAINERGFVLHTRAGNPRDHWHQGKWLFLHDHGHQEVQPREHNVDDFALAIGDEEHSFLRSLCSVDRLLTITRTDEEPLMVYCPPRGDFKTIPVAWGTDLR